MKIQNKQFGEINFESEAIIKFNEGILGFEEYKEYLLISEKEGFFYWLTAINRSTRNNFSIILHQTFRRRIL